MTNGRILSAEEIFALCEQQGTLFQKTPDELVYDVRDLDLCTFSLNKKTGQLEKKRIDLVWQLSGGETISVALRNGVALTTSPEHKYMVLDGDRLLEKKACELSLKDRVVCARRLATDSDLCLKSETLQLLAQKRFYVHLKEDAALTIKEKLLKDLRAYHPQITDLKYKSFYHGVWRGRYLLSDFMKICSLFSIALDDAYDMIDRVNFRVHGHRGKSSIAVTLPSNFANLFYVAGLMFGDGHHKKFIVGKPELGKIFSDFVQMEFGIQSSLRQYDRTPELVSNRTILEILHSLFGYPKKRKSHSIAISDFVYRAPCSLSKMFIRGYFDTDGTVEQGRRAISVSSASWQMIEDLYFLLLQFGCISQKYKKKQTLYISGKSMTIFNDEIGFGLADKRRKALNLATRSTGSLIYDLHASSDAVAVSYSSDQLGLMRQQVQLSTKDLAFVEVSTITSSSEDRLYDFTVADNHNFVAEGAIVHNTTFSDNLLAGAGMISEELAGKQRALDFHEDEQARGITIDSASVSMVHPVNGKDHLINLIDTPGHVDFGGDVTRAMRAVDGAIVLSCAVEEIMPQTETVLKQALRERVKPVLFINKVDRLIKEVKLTPEAMQQKFVRIITNINKLISDIAPEEFKEKWHVNVADGSVAFGSAFHNWALSIPYMQKHGITFKDIIDAYQSDDEHAYKELAKKAPLHEVVLSMSVQHHPNPVDAQKYRIPKIWHGEMDSPEGKSLLSCDPNGPVAFVVTKIVVDKHAGEIATGRLFSGTIKQGQDVYLNMAKRKVRLQQVSIYKGAQRIQVDAIPAGNIIGLVGLKDTFAGETISSEEMVPFEAIKHLFEPVVTKSIEATKPADLPKLVEVLRQVGKEDPSLKIEINEETGENLLSGMGELHLEIIEDRIVKEKGLKIKTSPPIVVYREAVTKESPEVEGKSPNKHNKFYMTVEPLPDELYNALRTDELPETRIRKKDETVFKTLQGLGYDAKDSKRFREFYNGCALIDDTRGIVHIGEVIEMIQDAFEQVMDAGPLAREPCMRLLVRIHDMKLHEDAIHRGPAQVYPAIREAIRGAMQAVGTVVFEPLQVLQFEAPDAHMGDISRLIANKRGQLLDMVQEGSHVVVKAKLPVAEMFGLTGELRSSTAGRGNFFVVDQVFERLPFELQKKVVGQIKQRKGLK